VTSVALDAPRRLGRGAIEVAEQVAAALRDHPDIAGVSVSPPGFVNLLLAPDALQEWLHHHLRHASTEPVTAAPAEGVEEAAVQALQRRHAWLATLIRYASAGSPLDRSRLARSTLALLRDAEGLEVIRVLLRQSDPARPASPNRDLHDAVVVGDAFDRYYSACRVVTPEPERTRARVWLTEGVRGYLFNSLSRNGSDAPFRM